MPFGKNGGSSSSNFDLKSRHVFEDATERDAYFSGDNTELEEGLFVSSDGVLQIYENSAWSDASLVIHGQNGSDGSKGEDGESAPNLKIQFSESGDSGWHEVQTTTDSYWRWSTDNGVNWSSDFVRFSANINVDLASTSEAGIVKPDGTTIMVSLDGTISSDVAAATKVSLSSEAEMLSLSQISNLYIVTRTDLERIWYLNSDTDPSVISNWVQGASVADTVSSFQGQGGSPRVGAVVASNEDYTLDLVPSVDTSTGTKYTLEITDGKLFMVEV